MKSYHVGIFGIAQHFDICTIFYTAIFQFCCRGNSTMLNTCLGFSILVQTAEEDRQRIYTMRPMIMRKNQPLGPSVEIYAPSSPQQYWVLRRRALQRKFEVRLGRRKFAAVELVRCMIEHPSMARGALIRERGDHFRRFQQDSPRSLSETYEAPWDAS